jgi:hypothetical protein
MAYPVTVSANIDYTLGEDWNETDGAQTLPPDSLDLSGEWGPARQDIRHRLRGSVNGDLWAGFPVSAQAARRIVVGTRLSFYSRFGMHVVRSVRLQPDFARSA